MAEKDEELADDVEQTEETKQDAQPAKNEERKYSDADVNKIVAKEKAAWKRTHDKAVGDHETIVDGLRKDVEKRDELITKQVDLLVKDLGLDDDTMELLNGLDVLAKYDWIMKKVEKAGKQDIPRTPKGSGESKSVRPFRPTQLV